ncbi:carboxymuconolactone decarboxylase family protein [Natrialbaceae archaeon A-arb3/5]
MPRIPYVSADELPEQYDIIEEKESKLPEAVDSEFWRSQPTVKTFSNNPALGEAHVIMNTELWTETGLTSQESECVILTIALAMDFDYQWHDHVIAARERAGLSRETILAISREEIDAIDEPNRSLVEYAFEFVETAGNISDETHERIAAQYSDSTIAGLAILAGYYVSMVHILRVLDIRLEEEFVGWELENYDG